MKNTMKLTALALALAGAFGSAQATSVIPGAVILPVDVVGAWFGGTVLNFASTNVTTPTYNGTARTAVVQNAGGTLDFYYQFTNNQGSIDPVEHLTTYNFSGFTVNAFQTSAAFSSGAASFLGGTAI